MKRHWETHLYTYAVALLQGVAITAANLAATRAKAIRLGHTEGECLLVELNPARFIRTGSLV